MDFDALFAKRITHIKPGLERMQKSFDVLGKPGSQIPSVLIGGTNGKGSTSGFLWSLLSCSLGRVGLYSSPHLMEFSERYQITGVPLSDQDVYEAWKQLKSQCPEPLFADLSFFELATLIAFHLFDQHQAQFQVLEVGLGGRWDACNVADPMVSVLVSVSRDHQEFLGTELPNILSEKLGIMRPGRPLFWGAGGEITALPEHRDWIYQAAAAQNCPVFEAGKHFGINAESLHIDLPHCSPLTLPSNARLRAMAPYLQANFALAAAVYHYVAESSDQLNLLPLKHLWDHWAEQSTEAPVTLLGRNQRIFAPLVKGGQALCLDVCHNPDGVRRFIEAWVAETSGWRVPALVSVLRDKDFDVILDELKAHLGPIVLYQVASERTWSREQLAARHQDLPFYASLEEAWQALREKAEPGPWVICGSVFAIGQVLRFLGLSLKEMHVARVLDGDWTFAALARTLGLRSGAAPSKS